MLKLKILFFLLKCFFFWHHLATLASFFFQPCDLHCRRAGQFGGRQPQGSPGGDGGHGLQLLLQCCGQGHTNVFSQGGRGVGVRLEGFLNWQGIRCNLKHQFFTAARKCFILKNLVFLFQSIEINCF